LVIGVTRPEISMPRLSLSPETLTGVLAPLVKTDVMRSPIVCSN
jgi:hypothetical protein